MIIRQTLRDAGLGPPMRAPNPSEDEQLFYDEEPERAYGWSESQRYGGNDHHRQQQSRISSAEQPPYAGEYKPVSILSDAKAFEPDDDDAKQSTETFVPQPLKLPIVQPSTDVISKVRVCLLLVLSSAFDILLVSVAVEQPVLTLLLLSLCASVTQTSAFRPWEGEGRVRGATSSLASTSFLRMWTLCLLRVQSLVTDVYA